MNEYLVDDKPGIRRVFHFPNGYGASVIPDGKLFELLVLRKVSKSWRFWYNTPVADDVRRGLTKHEVYTLLKQISELP